MLHMSESGFAEHLKLLTLSGETSSDDRRFLDEWMSYVARIPPDKKILYDHDVELLEDNAWDSVIHIFNDSGINHRSHERSAVVSRLLSRSEGLSLLVSLNPLLSSSRPDDAIEGDVAEIIGFDDIESVMEILSDRASVAAEISIFLASGHTVTNGATNDISLKQEDGNLLQTIHSLDARRRIENTLKANASRPLFTGTAQAAPEILPHVYTSSSMTQGHMLSDFATKYILPIGTTRHNHEDYEEVVVPPAKTVPPRESERLIAVSELDQLAQGSFPGYKSLNRIQSIVYPTAYRSNENMLICAPTGAGKTDVAMMAILRVLDQHRSGAVANVPLRATIDKDSFKIIYVAPMKALASEIVRKLGKRLQWLSIQVRELTGDMQLTKTEIAETQIIVTTPEKWDVVTRKPTGEGELASKLKLLIIDEVHLLNEDRGAVIETIVARTLRQVESSQSVIRIVGLSATLPNYIDVADFLSVSRYTGLFFFDSSFRPVPLEQHFIGVKGKPGSTQSRKNLDRVSYEKVAELVKQGHQVMVFVHARKETVKTATALKEAALAEGILDEFSSEDHPQFSFFRKSIGESRNKEMKQLFDNGFGIHHAGMLRTDRNMMERMFEARAIKVLCCTATLAWGVNLPAHAVVIKGTQVYDSTKGSFVDLSVLDVLQVFGRAGRPGLETSGEGYICTTQDKLPHYLDSVTSQSPIESKFTGGMVDALNAEISLGTVTNTVEAVRWLGYTYLFVRMRKNPFQYGIPGDILSEDPQLHRKRNELVTLAARKLSEARMIIFDQGSGKCTITDLGRIAAKYYIRHSSIEIFNKEFKPKMTQADVLAMLSMSSEFDQIQLRESEVKELNVLMENVPCAVKGVTDTSQGKVNILLQGYISRLPVDDFALVSDTAYVAQNGGRIVRALLEIAISRKWAHVTIVLIGMSKAIEQRLWPFDEPMRQFNLRADILYGLEHSKMEYPVSSLVKMSAAELGELVRLNERHGMALLNAAKQFPAGKISYDLRPLGSDMLKIAVTVARAFDWSNKIHGPSEPFWLWVEDHTGLVILQLAQFMFHLSTEAKNVDFVIFIPNGQIPPFVTIRLVSDRWVGAEDEVTISLERLTMPAPSTCNTLRLSLPSLDLFALHEPKIATSLPHFHTFDAIQTQVFWSVFSTWVNALVSAPVGSGKSMMARLLIWKTLLRRSSNAFVLLITPRKALALECLAELQMINAVGASVELGHGQQSLVPPTGKVVRVVTPSVLLAAIRHVDGKSALTDIDLVVCENLEQLDSSYELAVSLLRYSTRSSPPRIVGFSNSLIDSADLAAWLDVDPLTLHSFKANELDQLLTTSIQTFPGAHSMTLLKSMVKPAYTAIQSVPSDQQAVVFVPSRNQCRAIALDIITQCALAMESEKGFLNPDVSSEYMEDFLVRFQDRSLTDFVAKGVGFFHEGMLRADRHLVLELFAEGILRVLLVPRDSCWALPIRAAVVVVMSTQYTHVEEGSTERQLRDYSMAEIVRMQSRAVRHSEPGQFHLFCQAEAKDTITRFLNDGLPLESQLLNSHELAIWYGDKVREGSIKSKQHGVDMLSWTFLARRLVSNPLYYDAGSTSHDANLSRVVDQLHSSEA